jgi:hypothetical protein
MKYAARWKVILHGVRMFCVHTDMKGRMLLFDDKELICNVSGVKLHVIDNITGELQITYDEDGYPEYLSDWAKEPMNVSVLTDFPLYQPE